jgi:hypothetical protein
MFSLKEKKKEEERKKKDLDTVPEFLIQQRFEKVLMIQNFKRLKMFWNTNADFSLNLFSIVLFRL